MNLNEIASSFYEAVKNFNSAITETVGIDAMWFRAVPDKNSSDVIISEYTLSNVEQGKKIKVVTNKSDYNPGAYKIDLFGVSYEAPFEITIAIDTWNSTFGSDTMPQKDDIVYIAILNKLFEVKTSTIQYSVAELPTTYLVSLAKYNPSASRRENVDLANSIAELTASQKDLFGDEISAEVANITEPVSFGLKETTRKDIHKDFDTKSVTIETVTVSGKTISDSYYSFDSADRGVEYKISHEMIKDSNRGLFFSCWVRLKEQKPSLSRRESLVTPMSFIDNYTKGKKETTFTLKSMQKTLYPGDIILARRGSMLSVECRVMNFNKDSKTAIVAVKNSYFLKLCNIVSNWWKLSGWELSLKNNIKETNIIDISGEDKIHVYVKDEKIFFDILGKSFTVECHASMLKQNWTYIGFCIDIDGKCTAYTGETYKYRSELKARPLASHELGQIKLKDSIELENPVSGGENSCIDIMNVRLYAPYNNMSIEQVDLDRMSQRSSNESDAIVIDSPNVFNAMNYIGRIS